jgi:peptidoglycan-associated lipoprotein
MRHIAAILLILGLLAACKSAPPPASESAGELAPRADASAIAQPDDSAGAVSAGTVSAGEVGNDAESTVVLPPELQGRTVIYFAFDSDSISAEDQELVAAHARFMAGKAGVRLRLEGHTDERGSPEYNIGLGERRAQAVRRALGLQGVADSRVATVSYGEERPAASGDNEDAYSRNRRVELVYLGG